MLIHLDLYVLQLRLEAGSSGFQSSVFTQLVIRHQLLELRNVPKNAVLYWALEAGSESVATPLNVHVKMTFFLKNNQFLVNGSYIVLFHS